jgi:hypothetical protein
MTIKEFFNHYQSKKTFLIGFYGGGNLGDELLLELVINFFKTNHCKVI